MIKKINKKIVATLFFIYLFLLVWCLLCKFWVSSFFYIDKLDFWTRKEWFLLGINPIKSFSYFSLDGTLPRYYFEQLLNVVALVPFGMLAPFLMKKTFVFLSAFCMIIAIELTQWLVPLGGFDIVDAMTNMLGVAIGVAIHCKLVCKMTDHAINKSCKIVTLCTLPIIAVAIYTFVFLMPDVLAILSKA